MFKSQLAFFAITEQNPKINVEWLELVTFDTNSGEITEQDNSNMTKAFIRGLMAVGALDARILDDLGL